LGGDGARWVGMNPGASFGSAKRWAPERYAEVGDRMAADTGARVAILGGAAERPVAEAIASAMQARAEILSGRTTLPELIGVLSRLSLLVTNDSGPMHLAAALGVPVVAVFGPTDWRETAPVGARQRLVREDVSCAPCKLRECPIDHRCMRLVTAGRVASAALELLA
jgi:heptosyltransferase-2